MRIVLIVVLSLWSCSSPPSGATDAGLNGTGNSDSRMLDAGGMGALPGADGGDVSQPASDAGTMTAPRRWPDEPAITHDVDADLSKVLERAELDGACDALKQGATDEATRLRCGKWMFFYETFGTIGMPTPLLEFNQRYYASTFFGPGLSSLGFIPDPNSTTGMPLGFAPTTAKLGTVSTTAFTCAACHFGKMPDGRYAVGYANQQLAYGTFLATLGAPLSLSFNANDPKIHPQVRAMLSGALATAKQNSGYGTDAALTGLGLLGAGTAGSLTMDEQTNYLALRNGTMDFLTPPLVDDGVWTVSRILSLWNIPSAAQRAAAQMPTEMLSWNGGITSLSLFLEGFVVIGQSKESWPADRLAPLEAYVRSLRAPAPLVSSASAGRVEAGARLFVDKGCVTCHAGPSGEGTRVFTFDEIGTDNQYGKIYTPRPNGAPCCGLGDDPVVVTRGVKAPRMSGLFSQTRFLHNGSVGSLESLFCLTARPNDAALGQSSAGHDMTCTGLTTAEKTLIIDYLKTL